MKQEAERIIQELSLLELLKQHGEAQVVGSVALDLLVKRDIDIHLLIKSSDLLSNVDTIYHQLLDRKNIREVRISDYRDRGGIKIGIDEYPGRSGSWSIDIWVTNRAETTGFALVEQLKGKLNQEERQAILEIKYHKYRTGQLRDGLSRLIYKAVIDQGVRTVAEFDQILSGRESSSSQAGHIGRSQK